MSWPGWNRTSVLVRFNAAAPLPTSNRPGAPAECHPRLAGLTRTVRSLDPRARCARRDLNRTTSRPSTGASAVGLRGIEPLPGVEPGDATRATYGSMPQRPADKASSAPADKATGQWSPRRVPPSASGLTRSVRSFGPKGSVCQAGFEPTTSRPRPGASAVGLRGHGVATRCRPGSPALRGRGRSRARRQSWPSWHRTRKLQVQSPAGLPDSPMAIGAEGGSRTRRPRGLSSRGMPVPFTPAWCATRDLNPDRHRLRACRSAIELAAPRADGGSRTRVASLEGWCLHAVRPRPHGGSPLNRPGPRGLQPRVIPISPRNLKSGPPESNRVSPESESGRLPSSSIPRTWTTADSNRAPPACKAGALPDELAAQGRRGYNRDGTFGRHDNLPYMVLTLWTCQ